MMELSDILCERCGARGVCQDGMDVFVACLCETCFDRIWKEYIMAVTRPPEKEELDVNTLSITCPSCQHVWGIETPDIPWRALPASTRVTCPSCHATIRVMVQAKEGQVHISFRLETDVK